MEKRNICLTITQIRSHVSFGNIYEKPNQNSKILFCYTELLKWHRSTYYINWAILIGDLVDVTTLFLLFRIRSRYSCQSLIGYLEY